MSDSVQIRSAVAEDIPAILAMIRELAEYEKLADIVETSEELLQGALFSERPAAEALIAEHDGKPAGYAIFFSTFSTFLAIQGIWLEDIYVRPSHRGAGAGRGLLAEIARHLLERGGERLEWSALKWNELALGFYAGLGAERMDEWVTLRLTGEPLRALAGEAAPPPA